MVKNSFMALLIHGVIGVISFMVFTFIINMIGINDNKVAYDIMIRIISVLISIGAALVYFMLGKKCLKSDSNLQSFSVWIVSLIGIALWILCYALTESTTIGVGQNVNWALYCLYNASFFPVMVAFSIENLYYLLPFAIVPSVLLWLGMSINSNQRKKIEL